MIAIATGLWAVEVIRRQASSERRVAGRRGRADGIGLVVLVGFLGVSGAFAGVGDLRADQAAWVLPHRAADRLRERVVRVQSAPRRGAVTEAVRPLDAPITAMLQWPLLDGAADGRPRYGIRLVAARSPSSSSRFAAGGARPQFPRRGSA